MNLVIIVLLVATLSSCAVDKLLWHPVEVFSSASAIHPSPDGRLYATLRYGTNPITVAIFERESGRVLGVAQSSAKLTEDRLRIRGKFRVTYAEDLSIIIVHEDFSDSSPNPRYILFQRKPSGNDYMAFYCAPPTAHTDQVGEFDFICPDIRQVSNDSVTLGYPGEPAASIDVPIKDLIKTTTPGSAQEVSSMQQ